MGEGGQKVDGGCGVYNKSLQRSKKNILVGSCDEMGK